MVTKLLIVISEFGFFCADGTVVDFRWLGGAEYWIVKPKRTSSEIIWPASGASDESGFTVPGSEAEGTVLPGFSGAPTLILLPDMIESRPRGIAARGVWSGSPITKCIVLNSPIRRPTRAVTTVSGIENPPDEVLGPARRYSSERNDVERGAIRIVGATNLGAYRGCREAEKDPRVAGVALDSGVRISEGNGG